MYTIYRTNSTANFPTARVPKAELIAKLETYPLISQNYKFETLAGAMITRESVTSHNLTSRAICKAMLNYMGSNMETNRNKRVNFEHTCLVVLLGLIKKNIMDDNDRLTLYHKFIHDMNKYDMKPLREYYLRFNGMKEIPDNDPTIYSDVRLSSDTTNILSLFSLKPSERSLWFNWNLPNSMEQQFTKIYENMYNYLFTTKRLSLSPTLIFKYLQTEEIDARLAIEIKPRFVMEYKHYFDNKDDMIGEIKSTTDKLKADRTTYLFDKIRDLQIYAFMNCIDTPTGITINDLLNNNVLPRNARHKVIRKLITHHFTELGIIRIEYNEGTMNFLNNERYAI